MGRPRRTCSSAGDVRPTSVNGCLTALAVATSSAAISVAASRPVSPVRFEANPGWHVGSGHVHACPGVTRSRCSQVGSWAATVPWRDCQDCATARRTLASLPSDGVVVYLLLASEAHLPRKPMHWPPPLRAAAVVSPVEGLPARIGYFGRAGRLHGFTAQIFIYFGRRHPTSQQVARAQAELRSARLP
jgi:hypothetical protein